MELALYCPVYGYYEKEGDTVGRRGDFYTSVSVGRLFGELLALQFTRWLREMEEPSEQRTLKPRVSIDPSQIGPTAESAVGSLSLPKKWQLVEAGAHKGELARDILSWLQEYEPGLARSVDYLIIEPSERRQDWQRQRLAEFASRVRWVRNLQECAAVAADLNGVPSHGPAVRGVIFSNELLDAMPVHRLGWDPDKARWFEWGVSFSHDRFQWTPLVENRSLGRSDLPEHLDPYSVLGQSPSAEFSRGLPRGFTIEICPEASQWWAQAAAILQWGTILTLDYGFEDEEWLSPARPEGTLRAYYHHQLSPDVLSNPGEQDLTAHVNFSALRRAGESAGLKTQGLHSQEQFLTRIATAALRGDAGFGEWTAERTRQFQTLTHPNHLGRSFRVLAQSHGASAVRRKGIDSKAGG